MQPNFKQAALAVLATGALLALSGMPSAHAWTSDNRNGTFTNPVLYGDYPDPDIIRVGSDFYMATTTFMSMPGLEILHSKDLVNWEITGYAAPTLTFNSTYSLIGGSNYSGGIWAPSLRYYNGTYYILDNINGVGTVVYRATNPAGPWTMNQLNGGLYDPGLVFDDDGTPLVYNGTGGNISVAVLDSGLTTIQSNTLAYTTSVSSEGSHAYKINGSYYVFNSYYGSDPYMLCSRSTSRTGPFTTTIACNNGTAFYGPHQGGILQLANGDWWGFSLSEAGCVGRDLWLGPVVWSGGVPYFGSASSPSIATTITKPNVGATYPVRHLPNSDDFLGSTLGSQWQWNHNPDNMKWSLTANPGNLRLYTQTAPNYSNARNTLTLRTEAPACIGTIKIDTSHLAAGDRAGLSLLEQYFGYVAVYKDASGQRIVQATNTNGSLTAPSEDIEATVTGVTATTLWLQVSCNLSTSTAQFSYSTDGVNFTPIGAAFAMHFTLTTFQGDRFGIFNYNPSGSAGYMDVDYFHQDGNVLAENNYELSPIDAPGLAVEIYNIAPNPGAIIDQWNWWNGPGQIFHAYPLGNNSYRLEPSNGPGTVMQASTSGTAGSGIVIGTYTGATNQQWTVSPSGSAYMLNPVSAPGMALDQTNWNTGAGQALQLWYAWGGTPQQWIITPLPM